MKSVPLTRIPHTIILCVMIVILAIPCSALDLSSGTPATGTAAISNGDTVTLRGIATGHPRNGLQVWVISKNYLRISSIPVNDDNTFAFELQPADTMNLAPGQYFVVVQHPMMNGQFDVYYDSATGSVINRQLGAGGTKIFQMSGSGSLQGPDSAQALVNAISSQNIDDSFTTYAFTISTPSVFIDPIGDHVAGDQFIISGSTNLAAGDSLMVDITSSSFKPTQKNTAGEFSGSGGAVKVVPGPGGYNRWSFNVDASTFRPDEYVVKVSGITVDVTGSATFNIVERIAPTVTVPPSTPADTTVIPTISATPPPAATTSAKSPVLPGIAAGAFVIIVLAKRAGF